MSSHAQRTGQENWNRVNEKPTDVSAVAYAALASGAQFHCHTCQFCCFARQMEVGK